MELLRTLQAIHPAAVFCAAGLLALAFGLVVWVVDSMSRQR